MKHLRAVSILGVLLLLSIAGGDWARGSARIQVAAEAAPCLANDPYELAQLAQVISRTAPPSAPVVINKDITVTFIRSGSMADGPDDTMAVGAKPSGVRQPDEQPLSEARLDVAPLRIFNTRTQFEFRVNMSESMLRDIYSCHERAGMTEAGGAADLGAVEGRYMLYVPMTLRGGVAVRAAPAAKLDALQPSGWSEGSDTRILRTPTTLWPWRAITQSSSWPNGEQSRCTMTLIGPRHLITAAHCLVEFGTSNWKNRKLTPARDGAAVEPYGFSQMTPNPPAGQEAWYIVPDPWLDPSTPDNIDKYQWDVGLVLMVDRLGDQTGWMGYGAYTAGELNQRYHYNRGYPGCQTDYVEKPQGCEVARLYGDTKFCEIGDYHHPGSNGWNREFSFSCDISRGHSGSAIYHYRYSPSKGKLVPVVTAVVSWHECFTCSGSDEYPNHARRITPWVLSLISWLREEFP